MSAILPYVGLNEVKEEWKECLKALLAEFVGTMLLVLLACGACTAHSLGNLDVVRIALAFGLTVATMAQSIGHISGCHINPGVTAGLLVGRKIGLIKGLLYIVVQCIGAIVGAALLMAVTGKSAGIGEVGTRLNAGQGFAIEFFITFALVLVVYAAAADEDNAGSVKGSAPLAIGLAISIGHLFAVPLTGAGMNPARSLGTAVITNTFANHWIYWVGPILGGIAAGLIYQMAFRAPKAINVTPQGEYKLTDVTDKP